MKPANDIFEKASRRAVAKRKAFPPARSVRYDRRTGRIVIALESGLELALSPKRVQGLENARPVDFMDAEITPSGLGVHFPRLNADLYIPGLLDGFLGSKRWMAREIGERDGAVSVEAKVTALRENGNPGARSKKPKGSATV